MNSHNSLNNLFDSDATKAASEQSARTSTSEDPNWDSLREVSDTRITTFDDLASVPFAGVAENANGGGSLPDDEIRQRAQESTSDVTLEIAEDSPVSPELQAFKNLFRTDLNIKRELFQLAPKATDEFNEASRMDYVENAYHSFRGFKHDFLSLAQDFELGKYVGQSTEDFFKRGEADFAISDYGADVTQKIYRQKFTELRSHFVEEVKEECVGYTLFGGDLSKLANDATTINELLHAYHSYIMNDEKILQRVPPLRQKQTSGGSPIVLRGETTPLGQQVFDAFPEDIVSGGTDIIAADEHVMMMVRDRGHALTITSEPDAQDPEQVWVNYNIPKICNEEMIKALPGLAGYTENGARGSFPVPRDELGSALANFISQVPTDDDIPDIKNINLT